jgi:hypothetical protein
MDLFTVEREGEIRAVSWGRGDCSPALEMSQKGIHDSQAAEFQKGTARRLRELAVRPSFVL